jgi:hypothetical protein
MSVTLRAHPLGAMCQLGNGELVFDRSRLLLVDLGGQQIADDALGFMLPLDGGRHQAAGRVLRRRFVGQRLAARQMALAGLACALSSEGGLGCNGPHRAEVRHVAKQAEKFDRLGGFGRHPGRAATGAGRPGLSPERSHPSRGTCHKRELGRTTR